MKRIGDGFGIILYIISIIVFCIASIATNVGFKGGEYTFLKYIIIYSVAGLLGIYKITDHGEEKVTYYSKEGL